MPHVVGTPAMLKLSFSVTGTPCRGPTAAPRASAASACFACSMARSCSSTTTALSGGLFFAMRWKRCVVSSADEILFLRMASAAASAVPKSASKDASAAVNTRGANAATAAVEARNSRRFISFPPVRFGTILPRSIGDVLQRFEFRPQRGQSRLQRVEQLRGFGQLMRASHVLDTTRRLYCGICAEVCDRALQPMSGTFYCLPVTTTQSIVQFRQRDRIIFQKQRGDFLQQRRVAADPRQRQVAIQQ